MTLTLTLHTPDGPLTLIGTIVPPCGQDTHASLRFSGIRGADGTAYYDYLHELLGSCIRLDELDSAIDRATLQAGLREQGQ
jgi:hypothetical protein